MAGVPPIGWGNIISGIIGGAIAILGSAFLKRLGNDLYDYVRDSISEYSLDDETLTYRTRDIRRSVNHFINDNSPDPVDWGVIRMRDDRSEEDNIEEHIRQMERKSEQTKDIIGKYQQEFGSDIELLIKEYKLRGYDVGELRDKHRVPANLHGLRQVTLELDRLESELDAEVG